MAGAAIEVEIDDKDLKRLLSAIGGRLGNMTPAMKIIGEVVRTSVVKNFEKGGRPTPWKPLSPETLKRKRGAKILVGKGMAGGLVGSIHWTASKDRVDIGTNKIYAAVHQFGIGAYSHVASRRGHPAIPARPFLVVQKEDWDEIKNELAEYVTGGRT